MIGVTSEGCMVAVDVDNLLISSAEAGQVYQGYDLLPGFISMFEWIQTYCKILCVHLYLPTSQFGSDALWHALWEKYKDEFIFELIHCPKKKPGPREKPDNVDAHLICHSRRMVNLLGAEIRYFCLASGDSDYSPFLWQLKREKNIEISFAIGSEGSYSKRYRRTGITAKHPATGEELIHYFSPYKTN